MPKEIMIRKSKLIKKLNTKIEIIIKRENLVNI